MANLHVYSMDGSKLSEQLAPEEFSVEPNTNVFHPVIKASQNDRRFGLADVKERGEVRGGGRKPFKQKGTGNARQGTIRSPLMPGGGKVFGPIPRSYHEKVNKRVRKQALQSAISMKIRENKLFVVDAMVFPEVKTKLAVKMLKDFHLVKAVFIDEGNDNLKLSVRNLPNAHFVERNKANLYDILRYDNVVISRASLEALQTMLQKGR